MTTRKDFRFLLSMIVNSTCKVEIIRMERIPQKEGCIVVDHHLGRLGALLVYTHFARQYVVLTLAEKNQ